MKVEGDFRIEELKQLIKSDILLFEQICNCLNCEGCKKIIKLRIEELLSQLNEEDLKEEEE